MFLKIEQAEEGSMLFVSPDSVVIDEHGGLYWVFHHGGGEDGFTECGVSRESYNHMELFDAAGERVWDIGKSIF